jgi:uncharacterized protein (DUF58 family)
VTFLTPLAFAWLLLVPVLVLLHFVRRAMVRRQVSNLFLWHAVVDSMEQRPRLQRLRSSWLLRLRIAFVMAVSAALATPSASCVRGRTLMIVVDVSASMQAADAGRSRFDLARELAIDAVADLSRRDRVGLITAGTVTRFAVQPSSDHGEVRRAILAMTPERGGADLDAALAVAMSASDKPDAVLVVTDVSAPAVRGRIAAEVRIARVGERAENVAITRLEARAHPGSPLDAQVFLEVANFGGSHVRIPVSVSDDSAILHSRTVELKAGARYSFVHNVSGRVETITARFDSHDSLAADNQASTRVIGATPVRVALSVSDSTYLRSALHANALVQVVSDGAPSDVFVCDEHANPCSTKFPGSPDESKRRAPDAQNDTTRIARPALVIRTATAPAASIHVTDRDHPVMSFVELDALAAVRVAPLRATIGDQVLARAGDAPVILASNRDRRRLEIGIDVAGGPFPQSVAFPILIANAVRWLTADVSTPSDSSSGVISEIESNLRETTDSDVPATKRSKGELEGATVPMWRPVLIVALLLFALEWFLTSIQPAVGRRPTVRVVVAALLLAALAGVEVATGAGRRHVVFVLDSSGSIAQSDRDRAVAETSAAATRMQPGDEASVVTFGSDALVEVRRANTLAPHALATTPDDTASDIGAALRLATSLAAAGDRIVLLSDGNDTTGEAYEAARQVAAEGVVVDAIALGLEQQGRPEVLAARLLTPPTARTHEPFEIAAELQSTVRTEATIRLRRDGQMREERRLELVAGSSRIVFVDALSVSGMFRYEVEVEADIDAFAGNNRAAAVVSVAGAVRLLHISTKDAPVVQTLLSTAGFSLARAKPDGIPNADALQAFDAVILDDVEATLLPTSTQEMLRSYVEQAGGGLLMTGAARSFGPGGWGGSRLEAALPVDMHAPARGGVADTALVLLLDKSGSMSDIENGARKIDVAIRAALPVVEMLSASQSVGVIAFDTTPVALVSLGESTDLRRITDRMSALTVGGGTLIAPAVELAVDWLRRSGARRRHILLLSDGRSPEDDLGRVAAAAARRDAVLSSVSVGVSANRDFLERLSSSTGGRAYFPDTVQQLSAVFMQEAALVASGWRVEEAFIPVPTEHPATRGLETVLLPRVRGYIATTPKRNAESVLVTHRRDPLIAVWQRGIGRAAVVTSDLDSVWASDLRGSSAFSQILAQTVRWIARPRQSERLHAAVSIEGRGTMIEVDAFTRGGGFLNFWNVHATLVRMAGDTSDVELRQTAPGHYESRRVRLSPGSYTMALTAHESSTGESERVVTAFEVSGAPEYRQIGTNLGLLSEITRITGGAIRQGGDTVFDRAAATPRRVEARQLFGAAALILFVIDIARRRGIARFRPRPGALLRERL